MRRSGIRSWSGLDDVSIALAVDLPAPVLETCDADDLGGGADGFHGGAVGG